MVRRTAFAQENGVFEVRSVTARSGARAIRTMVEAGLDERCHRLEYAGLERWDSGDEGLSVYVCWW